MKSTGNRKTEEVWSREMGLSEWMMLRWARSCQSFPWPHRNQVSLRALLPVWKQSENQHCLPELNYRTTELSPLTLCPLQFIMVLLLFISFLRTIVQVNNTFLKFFFFFLPENDRAARKPSSSRVWDRVLCAWQFLKQTLRELPSSAQAPRLHSVTHAPDAHQATPRPFCTPEWEVSLL